MQLGAKPDARDARSGFTPLHLAADAGYTDVMRLLAAGGALLDTVSLNNWSSLALAVLKVWSLEYCSEVEGLSERIMHVRPGWLVRVGNRCSQGALYDLLMNLWVWVFC